VYYIVTIKDKPLAGRPLKVRLQFGCQGPALDALTILAFIGMTATLETSPYPVKRDPAEEAAAVAISRLLFETAEEEAEKEKAAAKKCECSTRCMGLAPEVCRNIPENS
jgi:hypothetical protein